MKYFYSFLCLLACLSLPAAAESPAPLKVGGIYGLTGLLPDLGEQFRKGSELFTTTTTDPNLALTIEDSRWDPKTAVSAYKKLVELEKVQVVHVVGSGPSLAIKPLSEADGVILFTAGAHPDLLPGKYVIRHANLASQDAVNLALAVAERVTPDTVVASIFLQNDWGVSYQNNFAQALAGKVPGVSIVSDSHVQGDTDFRTVLMKLLAKKPGCFAVNSAGMPAYLIVEQLRQLGFAGDVFVSNGLALSREAEQKLRSRSDAHIYYQRYPDLPKAFVELYRAQYHSDPEYFSLVAYTDMELLRAAAEKVGTGGENVVGYIKGLGTFDGKYLSLTIGQDGDIRIPTVVQRLE